MKKIFVVLIVVLAILLSISVFKDQLIRSTVATTATNILGAPVRINSFSLSLFKQAVSIGGLKISNPKGFPEGTLVDITKIAVACDLAALVKKELHLKHVEIDIKEIGIIRNKEGKLNVEALKVTEKKPAEKPAEKEEKPAEQIPMRIDTLKLNVGNIIYKDYSKGEPPVVHVYDSGIHGKTYTNITSANQLVALILSESLKNTAIQSAKVYAASAVLGVGFLPAGVAVTLLGKDSTQQNFDVPLDRVYASALKIVESTATVKKEDKASGVISATMADRTTVTVKISSTTPKTTQVTVSARKLLLPKPEIAKGILLQISDKLK